MILHPPITHSSPFSLFLLACLQKICFYVIGNEYLRSMVNNGLAMLSKIRLRLYSLYLTLSYNHINYYNYLYKLNHEDRIIHGPSKPASPVHECLCIPPVSKCSVIGPIEAESPIK